MAGGWRRGVAVGVIAIALLAAGSELQSRLPGAHDDPASEPFVRIGEIGDDIDIRTAVVTVKEVAGSATVDEYGTEKVSPGVWVAAYYTVVAKEETTTVTFAELVDDGGRVWGLVGRNANACMPSPPGLAAHCFVHFEVPPDAVPSLRLRLARGSEFGVEVPDVTAEVDLDLTAADAATFQDAEPLDIPGATLGNEEPT